MSGGEYYGLDILDGPGPDSLRFIGVASSFIRTRSVQVGFSGDLVSCARQLAPRLATGLGGIWELRGHVDGRPTFPFLECESVALPGTPGALVRIMSEYGEQQSLYLTGCPDMGTTAWLVACIVNAAALSDYAWIASPAASRVHGVITLLTDPGTAVRGTLEASWLHGENATLS
jgi:hypothetical protein